MDSSSAKKSSGLKCIANQVIQIIQKQKFMTYSQVAAIVVKLNLKSIGSVQDSDGLCSQSNILENESCWGEESNMVASAKKPKKQATQLQ